MNTRIATLFEKTTLKSKFNFKSVMSTVAKDIVMDFCDFCQNKLHIETMPTITIVGKRVPNMSTGSYTPGSNTVLVLGGKRALLDVLRSIAHELTHRMQDETGALKNIPKQGDRSKDDMSDVGVDFEDEANAKGGALVKEFSRKYGKVSYDDLFEL